MALPTTRYNFQGGKKEVAEAVQELGQAIFNSAKVSIASAAKSVVPSIPNAIKDITQEIERGPINNFDKSLEKLNNLVSNLGVSLEDYNKDLARFLKEREDRIVESEKKVEQLRIQNVTSEVNRVTGEVNILSKKEIEKKKQNVEFLNNLINQEEKALKKNTKVLQEKDDLSDKEVASRKIFISNQTQKVADLKEQREKELDVLGRPEESRGFEGSADRYVPAPLMDIFSSIKEGFLAPITAVKEIGLAFGEFAKPLRLVVDIFKPLLANLKKFVVGLAASVVAFLPYLAIGAAVVAALFGLYKAIQKIAGFFGFGKSDEEKAAKDKIDRQEGKGKYQSLDEGFYDVGAEEMTVSQNQIDPGARDTNSQFREKLVFDDTEGGDRAKILPSLMSKGSKNFMETKGYQKPPSPKLTSEDLMNNKEQAAVGNNTIVNAPTQQVNQNTTNNLPNLDGSTNDELWYNRSVHSI